MNRRLRAATVAASLGVCCSIASPSLADDNHESDESGINALDHAPIGVMADHRHGEGEWMISYRVMHMDMGGVHIGTDSVDPETVVTTVPNVFAGAPMQPPTLRIVPTSMRMDMHMAGAMYGLSDTITLMAMANYITKEMDHTTFQGGMGTTQLGEFRTTSAGFGDTKLAALIGLSDNVHLNAGISIPIGSISETDEILTPMGGTPTVRLPYPMQIGSGTWDLEPGITYRRQTRDWGWGAQVIGTIRLGNNSSDYSLGNKAMVTAWAARSVSQAVALSARVQAETRGQIDGFDPQIVGPVQTANPDFQGGESVTAFAGINFAASKGTLSGWRLGMEFGIPVLQDLNGPQMPNNWSFTIGLQKSL